MLVLSAVELVRRFLWAIFRVRVHVFTCLLTWVCTWMSTCGGECHTCYDYPHLHSYSSSLIFALFCSYFFLILLFYLNPHSFEFFYMYMCTLLPAYICMCIVQVCTWVYFTAHSSTYVSYIQCVYLYLYAQVEWEHIQITRRMEAKTAQIRHDRCVQITSHQLITSTWNIICLHQFLAIRSYLH
jgi:hypothetical protein